MDGQMDNNDQHADGKTDGRMYLCLYFYSHTRGKVVRKYANLVFKWAMSPVNSG